MGFKIKNSAIKKVWKVVKKFRKRGQTSGKHEGKVEDKSPSFGDQTGRRGWNQPDIDAPHP